MRARFTLHPLADEILTRDAVAFLMVLHRQFNGRREELLAARSVRQVRFDAGERPNFLPQTAAVRSGDWQVAEVPKDLLDRRVEITGPVGTKMMIDALNSDAKVLMADFEDATSPTWANMLSGQRNLRDAHLGQLRLETCVETFELNADTATLMMRPRGWHLIEKNFEVDGEPISASLFDFGLMMFHTARLALDNGTGPYFYLPKIENHLEAHLWNDVFIAAQDYLHIPHGTIKATVLIETITAAFEMDEILYELREHSAGLNAGRFDYLFSILKSFAQHSDFLLPDLDDVSMTDPFLRAYTDLLISTCHKRGAHAIGGMAAFIPDRREPEVTEAGLAKVKRDKKREAAAGFDGTWVAHPDLVPIALAEFDAVLGDSPDQLANERLDVDVVAADLLDVASAQGNITEAGLRFNVDVGIRYLSSWLSGHGAAEIQHLMDDASMAELSRAQIWQWVAHSAEMDDGEKVTAKMVRQIINEELAEIEAEIGPDAFVAGRFGEARELFEQVALSKDFEPFLTLPAYQRL